MTRPEDDDDAPAAAVRAKDGLAQLADTRLWYTDTGGTGPAIVFLHPTSGSALVWGSHQQPAFAAAGYRVVAYSRRSHYNSDAEPETNAGIGSRDLHDLIEFLGLAKFHLIASAGGVIHAIDYALSHPARLLSMVLANGVGGVRDPDYVQMLIRVRTKGFDDMPVEFRELSPAYRATDPDGVRQWLELHRKSVTAKRTGQRAANEITWAALPGMKSRRCSSPARPISSGRRRRYDCSPGIFPTTKPPW